MMTDIKILQEMLKEAATVTIENPYNKTHSNQATLVETDAKHKVTIYGLPDEVMIIKTDNFPPPKSIFRNTKHECKRADFVIITNTHYNENFIVCIEMKTKEKTSSREEIIQQLKGAKCFIAYCQEIGKMFWNDRNFLSNYNYRYVTIRKISISKKTTRYKKQDIHDQPEKMLKMNSRHLSFKNLIEGI